MNRRTPTASAIASVLGLAFSFFANDTLAANAPFYFGNDLSYVNQMEDAGAVYRENGAAKDVYRIMADHGTNLVRVRLWHDPWWQPLIPQTAPNAKPQYNDLTDVTKTIRRAKAAGMAVMLDIHFSDFWADPGRQVMPRAWSALANDDAALETAVHAYVRDVLTTLDAQGLMPEIVQLGNETNPGLLISQTLTASWNTGTQQLDYTVGGVSRTDNTHFSRMWNAGIRAVRETGAQSKINPRIALHVASLTSAMGFFDWMQSIGVTDFDIMALSYYYAWHSASIAAMGNTLRQLKTKYPGYQVLIAETGYLWDQQNIDGLGNIINTPDPSYLPVSQANQRRYMVDYTQEVINAGGMGVVFWESAWVSTVSRTPWGVGSSHEHVAYFDHRDSNNFHVGGTWMQAVYTGLPSRAPTIAAQPLSQTVAAGGTAVFSVEASSSPAPTYQWQFNGAPIPGATSALLVLRNLTSASAGSYQCAVTNSGITVSTDPATLSVVNTSDPGKLTALSIRGVVGTGGDVMIAGIIVENSTVQTLIQAVGPTLGVIAPSLAPTVLQDSNLELYRLVNGSFVNTLQGNNDWGGSPSITAAAAATGATQLTNTTSKDSSLLATLSPGVYTANVNGVGNTTGVALLQAYAVPSATDTGTLTALSIRGRVGTGGDIMIAGIIIGGSTSRTLLIQAVGPTLGVIAPSLATSVLNDTTLELYQLVNGSFVKIRTNDDWGGDAQITTIQAATGATGLSNSSSRDSALLVTLPPGVYTANVSGVNNTGGVVLLQAYAVP